MESDEKCKPSLMVSVTTPTNTTPQPQALNIIEHCNNTNNKTPLTTPPVVSQDDHDSDIDDLLKEYEDFANDEFSFDDLPPGYRFCPTDVELIRFYLNKKVSNEPLPPNQIVETNLYGYNPEFLAANYKKCGENELYFFTPRDRKYLNGVRPNRAAGDGYWKATGVDKPIIFGETLIGYKKALVFCQGKPPNGTKTNWIMHEFRVDTPPRDKRNPSDMRLDDSVLCRIYKKTDPKTKSNRKSTWINIRKGMELEEALLDLFFDTFPFDTFPPGYRFCPTDDELVRFYLNKKVSNEPLPPNQIVETNLYHHNPEFLAANNKKFGENELYFFTPRDRKYLNGNRPNRAAGDGYWKATGADKHIIFDQALIGYRKALVFYRGKAPNGTKTNWIMHEFRVDTPPRDKRSPGDMKLDESVLCRIYQKSEKESKSNKYSTQAHTQDQEVPNSTSLPQNEPMEHFEFQDPMAQMIYDHDYMLQSDQNAPSALLEVPQNSNATTLIDMPGFHDYMLQSDQNAPSALLEVPQNSNATTLIDMPGFHDPFQAMGGNIFETPVQSNQQSFCFPPSANSVETLNLPCRYQDWSYTTNPFKNISAMQSDYYNCCVYQQASLNNQVSTSIPSPGYDPNMLLILNNQVSTSMPSHQVSPSIPFFCNDPNKRQKLSNDDHSFQ